MRLPTKLERDNALALATLPAYLASRPFLRQRGALRERADGPWVIGGHSGRLYEDNAAALHAAAHAAGRDVRFVVANDDLKERLRARGYQVLMRNSFEARIAIENAEVLAYSHGLSDLDHVLTSQVALRGTKVHLFHSLTFFKAQRRDERAGNARAPFDYLLAVSPLERANLQRRFPGLEAKIVLGGAAHLDPFMRMRDQPAQRSILYFPTHRDSEHGRARLQRVLDELLHHPTLHAFLEREDMRFDVVAHVNRAERGASELRAHPRVRVLGPDRLMESVLHASALISDYSGLFFDQLALNRPAVFFPFDHDEYMAERELYAQYHELGWGPRVDSVSALIELLDSGRYADMAPYASRRRHWERACFPRFTPDYAAHSLRTIDALLARQRDTVTPIRRASEPEILVPMRSASND